MFDNRTYDEVHTDFLLGIVTNEEWHEYCQELLYKIMQDNIELFKRMKEN